MSRGASDRCWPISRERNVLGRPKLVERLSTPRAIMRPRFKVKSQRSRSPGWLMLRPEVRHIFRMGRSTNFRLGTQTDHIDPHQRQAPWPSRSKVKVKVARSRDASDRWRPIIREWNVLETPKLVRKLSTSRAIMRTSLKVKGQRSRSSGRLMLRLEVRHIFRMGRPTKFNLGIQTEDEDPRHRQASWPPRSKVKVARSRDVSGRFDRYVENETSYKHQN